MIKLPSQPLDAAQADVYLGQHRTIWQEAPAWIFGSIQSLENEGILYVFLVFQTEEVGQKDGCGSQTQLCGVALESYGLKVIRYSNREIDREFPVVCQQIDSIIRERRS